MFKLNTWITLEQFGLSESNANLESGIYDFEIMVPKNIAIEVNAEYLKAYYCKLQTVESKDAVIRECELADGYIGKGKNAMLRETDIGENAQLFHQRLEVRECDTKSMSIGIEESSGVLDALFRDNKGSSLTINAQDYNDLSILLRDSQYDSLTVISSNNSGEINLLRSKIKNLNNQSGIEIKNIQKKQWNETY
jgi:hypothetical protein